jgi:hypothetical protein
MASLGLKYRIGRKWSNNQLQEYCLEALDRAVTLPQNKRSHRQGAHHALVVEVLRGFVFDETSWFLNGKPSSDF